MQFFYFNRKSCMRLMNKNLGYSKLLKRIVQAEKYLFSILAELDKFQLKIIIL